MVIPRKASSAARRSRGGAPGFVTRATFGLSSSRTAAPLATGVAMRSLGVCAPAFLGALVLAGSPLSAQRKELTVLAGANYSGATGGNLAKSQSRSGFLGGLSLRLPRSSQVSFQTEFLVVQRRLSGERAPSSAPPIQVGPISDAARLLYAEVPLMIRFQRGYSTERVMRPFLTL